jgi:hypothetical protein
VQNFLTCWLQQEEVLCDDVSIFFINQRSEMKEERSINCLYQIFNPLNTQLNPICHLLALLEAHHILHVSRIRVKLYTQLTLFVWLQVVCMALYSVGLFLVPLLQSGMVSCNWMKWKLHHTLSYSDSTETSALEILWLVDRAP